MKLELLIFIIYIGKICVINGEECKVTDRKMDCSNQGLVDCPDVNPNITELILDSNKLIDLKTSKCDQWTNLFVFSANNNGLINLGRYIMSSQLTEIYVRHNKLDRINISGEKLTMVDLSYNQIQDISISRLASLSSFLLGHNVIDPESLRGILYANLLPRVRRLDFSYNNLTTIPIGFMSFLPSFLTEVDLSGNKISTVYFTLFTYKSHRTIRVNLSSNDIDRLVLDTPPTIDHLDLSGNRLTVLDLASTKLLVTVPSIDVSNNPFNCSCNNIPPFIKYIREHQDSFVHKGNTNCTPPHTGPNIFNMHCIKVHVVSSTTTVHYWPTVVPIVISVFLALTIIGILLVMRLRRLSYTELGTSDRCSSIWHVSSMITNCRGPPIPVTINDSPATNAHPPSTNDHHASTLDLEDKLVIMCSSDDKKWVTKEIVENLTIETKVFVSKVHTLPSSEFVLLVVGSENALRDATFVKNISLALQNTDRSEVRLLMRCIPSKDSLRRKTELNNYVKRMLSSESYFKFEDDYPLTCLDSLKAWLNLEA